MNGYRLVRQPQAPALLARPALDEAQQRVVDRKPTAYITKEAVLGKYSLRADERAIIPRSRAPLAARRHRREPARTD